MGVVIDMEEARREENAYWKEFAAIKGDEGDDELDDEQRLDNEGALKRLMGGSAEESEVS